MNDVEICLQMKDHYDVEIYVLRYGLCVYSIMGVLIAQFAPAPYLSEDCGRSGTSYELVSRNILSS
jgi:hypothetical protein